MDKSIIINTPHGRLIITKLGEPPTNFIIEIHKEVEPREHKFQVSFLEITLKNIREVHDGIEEFTLDT